MLVYADTLIVDNFEFRRNLNAANQILWTDETKAVLNVAKRLNERKKNLIPLNFHGHPRRRIYATSGWLPKLLSTFQGLLQQVRQRDQLQPI